MNAPNHPPLGPPGPRAHTPARWGVGSNQYQKRPGRDPGGLLDPQAAQRTVDPGLGAGQAQVPATLVGQPLADARTHDDRELAERMLQALQQADQQLAQLRQTQLVMARSLADPDRAAMAGSEVFLQLIEDLDRAAPPGHWFGPHPHNLSSWGFWPERLAPAQIPWFHPGGD